MKNISITLILLISSFLTAQSNETKLNADIRGRDCKGGLSLCTVEINSKGTSISSKFTLVKLSETELQLVIPLNELSLEEQKYIFKKNIEDFSKNEVFIFTQDYDYELSSNCSTALDLNYKNAIIKSGNYPIKFEKDTAFVVLKMSTKI